MSMAKVVLMKTSVIFTGSGAEPFSQICVRCRSLNRTVLSTEVDSLVNLDLSDWLLVSLRHTGLMCSTCLSISCLSHTGGWPHFKLDCNEHSGISP